MEDDFRAKKPFAAKAMSPEQEEQLWITGVLGGKPPRQPLYSCVYLFFSYVFFLPFILLFYPIFVVTFLFLDVWL